MTRRPLLAAMCVLCLLLAGCVGWSTAPTAVSATSATLHAQASCRADNAANPCTYWFQYWVDGSATVLSTPHRDGNTNTGGAFYDVAETITGLTPNTLYRSQFCGYGDTDVAQPGACIGQPSNPITQPGWQPDPGEFSATQNFRTAGPGTLATVDLGRPLSVADTAANRIPRDAGLSAAWSGSQALWLFGDTVQKNGPAFLPGTTAAAGPYTRGQVPTTLQELPTPPAPPASGRTSPALFLPVPQGLQMPSGAPPGQPAETPCGTGGTTYAASWPSGVTAIPGTATLLITYAETCVISAGQLPEERFSMVRYDPATNRFLGTATPFVASPLSAGIPAAERLGSPVFGGDGYLYLYATDVTTNRIIAARVSATPSAWGNRGNYRWWNGSWQSNPALATSVASVPFAGSVHVADYAGAGSHRSAMIVQTGFGSAEFQVLQATTPAGPWTLSASGRVPDPCTQGVYACYALSGHAELSTAGQFWYSWYSPEDANGAGHIRLAAIAW
ncbi:hypothetical protein [Paractinoplanes toevensis]|uniref:DUF4185 domain-containing protein n=1 Tax=Paractinoplanes toevensis TaxID=571911 RepID=A0A919T861_9ACTN|nr:hypothetical protein [Actinoplanes toevensis]GIM89851.1 hypothetical protein Ato02nite_016440 [Actinoplanes toevensis]